MNFFKKIKFGSYNEIDWASIDQVPKLVLLDLNGHNMQFHFRLINQI